MTKDLISAAVAVIDHCEIQPATDTTTEITLPLLHFDITWLFFHPVHRLLFFEFSCSKKDFNKIIVPKLKESLAHTLGHFLPLAGKIVHPFNYSRPFCRYAVGNSVSLTIAESDKDFAHLTGNHSRVADDFYVCVPQLPSARQLPDEAEFPALALQITLFPGEGLCLGFTNHHAIGDANTIVRFIKAWASINKFGGDAELIEDKLLPFFDRTTVADPEGLDSIYWNIMKRWRSPAVQCLPISFPLNRVRATFVLTRDDVQKLKILVLRNRPEQKHVTAFTVTCALVWVCLAKAEPEALEDDEPAYIAFAADCRGRLNPPLPPAYFGNCLAFVKAELNHGLLKGEDGLSLAAQCVGESIHNTVYNEKGILDGAENWPLEFGKLVGKRLFGVAGSPRFDLYDADYGWGRPKKFESASIDNDTSMSLCKSRDVEGGLEIGLSRPQKILDAFSRVFSNELQELRCEKKIQTE